VLVGEIRVLHAGSRGAYGAPRIHAALRRAGWVVNSKKIERLMRKHRIVGITRRRRRGLTRQAKRAVFALDLIGRDFTAPRPGVRLVGDMTELSTLEGKLYLAILWNAPPSQSTESLFGGNLRWSRQYAN
jgi:transposase InsO family protein